MPITPRIASPYGMRQRPSGQRMHHGVDIVADEGHPVYALLPGVVTHATANGAPGFSNYGHTVVVRHELEGGPVWTLHAHLLRPGVTPGQRVGPGDVLGWVGKSRGRYDRATGQQIPDFFHTSVPHLHFEIRTRSLPAAYGDGALDPQAWLAARGLPLPTNVQGPTVAPPHRTAPATPPGWASSDAETRRPSSPATGPTPARTPQLASMGPLVLLGLLGAAAAALAKRRG